MVLVLLACLAAPRHLLSSAELDDSAAVHAALGEVTVTNRRRASALLDDCRALLTAERAGPAAKTCGEAAVLAPSGEALRSYAWAISRMPYERETPEEVAAAHARARQRALRILDVAASLEPTLVLHRDRRCLATAQNEAWPAGCGLADL